MLYTGSGSPIPNDKPMEQFKASDEDWKEIENAARFSGRNLARTVRKLRDRVAALEAERAPEESSAAQSDPQVLFSVTLAGSNAIRWEMVVCPICGNKRCPHATDPALACTGSNEPDQPGSIYTTQPTETPDD